MGPAIRVDASTIRIPSSGNDPPMTEILPQPNRGDSNTGRSQSSYAIYPRIVAADIAGKRVSHRIDVESPVYDHLLKVHPVLRPVEEGFEDRQITTGEERNPRSAEKLPANSLRHFVMKGRGVKEHVNRGLIPPEPGLAVSEDRPMRCCAYRYPFGE